MEKSFLLLFFLLLHIAFIHGSNHDERTPYIVYMGNVPKKNGPSLMDSHHGLLLTAIGDKEIARQSMIHSYRKSFNAVAARLLPHEAQRLSEMPNVVSVFPNTYRKLHTTRSWNFLNLSATAKRNLPLERNLIVGMMDTGIWPSAPSFNDNGYGPPPAKWKGTCMKGRNFSGCNKKVIGARYYRLDETIPSGDVLSPADAMGHGTHTASTVAGIPVVDASLYGIANGTAHGGVPTARIAVYKVCWIDEGCSDMDILAAFDDAIADGVDIISASIGGYPMSYFKDSLAIGSFHALKRGILTSCSAGNEGPYEGSVNNVAPWILTVAASGIDRQFRTLIRLGNGNKIPGVSINTYSPKKRIHPLIAGSRASNGSVGPYGGQASACDFGTLDKKKVSGKVVYCIEGMGGQDSTVKELGGAGTLIRSDEFMDTAFSMVLPGAYITSHSARIVAEYTNSTKNPQAVIYKTREVHVKAPFVASFSARGPNMISPKILKPDITAPGLNILAAYSRLTTVTGSEGDTRVVNYNIMSGTSMSCPHATATAAYVKSFHPDWSPAAIKSAIITTAKDMSWTKEKDAELSYGGGHIHPTRAVHPGLIYDADEFSYIQFLCKEGYNGTLLQMLGSGPVNCSKYQSAPGYDGLNYPTLQYQVPTAADHISAAFHRTVTNVGNREPVVYNVTVSAPKGLTVSVQPKTLTFRKLHQKKSFKVILKGDPLGQKQLLSAHIMWTDGNHYVRSPIVVFQPFF